VLTVELEPAGLFAGSDGDAFGVVNHGRNAFWPTPNPGIEVRKTANRAWVLAPSGNVTYTVRVQNTFTDRAVTLNALTDSRLGSLAGAGTCSLPQTITAGSTYSCQVSESVSGTAGTSVAGTVTATATPTSGPDVTDTDTMTEQILTSAPVFRARVVVGPAQVVFPGQTVRFSVTMMNLDPERSATLTSLTSTQFGNVTSECGLPVTLGPNRLKYCHVDRFVSGSVGSKPTFNFTASASYNTGPLTSAVSATITMNPPVGGSKVLAVVANPAAPSASDKKIQDFVEDNYQITYVDDDTVTPADVTSDYSFVLLDPSVVPTKLGTRLAGLTTSVMLTHSQLLDEMGMAPTGADGTVTGTTVNVVKPMHPLSAAKFGTQTINSAVQTISWGTPSSAAQVITQVAANQATEFAWLPDVLQRRQHNQVQRQRVGAVQPGSRLRRRRLRREHALDSSRQRRHGLRRRGRAHFGLGRHQHAMGPGDRRPEPHLRRRRGQQRRAPHRHRRHCHHDRGNRHGGFLR
jgi:hypothetical protein